MAFNNPSKPSNLPIGMDLVELQNKMKFMPPQWLKAQVDNQTPAALPAAMRLSELAGEEQRKQAAQAQGAAQQPTVVEAAAQQLGIGSLAPPQAALPQAAPPQAAPQQRPPMAPPQAAPQQAAPQQAPQQRPPMTPQLAQALQMAMAQRQGGQGDQGVKGLAKGGAIAFQKGEDVPWMNRVNREAHERGVRETNEYLASIKDPEEREKARRALYGPASDPIGGLLGGLSSMGAATKDILSAPVRLAAGLAEKYLPIPNIPDSFYGGDRSSLTPYMDKLRQEQTEKGGSTDEAALSDRAKFAYGPASGWAGVPSGTSPQPSSGIASPSPAAASAQMSELEQKLIEDGVTDPRVRARIIQELLSSKYVKDDPSSVRTFTARQASAPAAATSSASATPSAIGPQQKALYDEIAKAQELFNQPPTPFSEADQNRIRQAEFARRQEVSKPYFARMEGLLAQERDAAANVTKGYNPWLEFGLTALATPPKAGVSSIAEAGVKTLARNEDMRKLEQAAIAATRKAEGLMLEARLRDERGDHEGAEKAVEAARKAQSDASTLARSLAKDKVGFAKSGAEAESKDELIAQRTQSAEQLANYRQQLIDLKMATNSAKLDPQVAQQVKIYDDRINAIDTEIKILERDPLPMIDRAKKEANLAQKRSERDAIQAAWGKLVGVTFPTSGAGGGGQKEVSFADAIKTR